MAQTLTAGYEVLINKRVGNNNVPIYPFTKTGLVENASGVNLDTILSWYSSVSDATPSGIRFLTTNNTFADIRTASTSQTGIVQLVDTISDGDTTHAATGNAVADAISAAIGTLSDDVVHTSQLGVATVINNEGEDDEETIYGIPTLTTSGLIDSSFLPSYVDDVVEFVATTVDSQSGAITNIYSDAQKQNEITGEANKIYVNTGNNLTYRWSGTIFVEISESLALGTTSSTAFRGDYGSEVYTWYQNYNGTLMELAVGDTAPTFYDSTNGGIWLQVITDETASSGGGDEPQNP